MVQDIITKIKSGISLLFKEEDDITPKNIAGLYFDIIQEHNVSVQNQITDNWMENNTAIGDHIAHQPIVITLRGLIGELVYEPPTDTLNQAYKDINSAVQSRFSDGLMANPNVMTDKLLPIAQLLPPVDNITQLAKNAVQYAESSFKRYEKIVKNLLDNNRESRLWQIYRDLIDLNNSNTAMIVETPYQAFDNMYIQSINFSQGEQLYTSDIVLTLKQVYFTDTLTTKADKKVLAQYSQMQRADVENRGKIQGNQEDGTLLYNTIGRKINIEPKIRTN